MDLNTLHLLLKCSTDLLSAYRPTPQSLETCIYFWQAACCEDFHTFTRVDAVTLRFFSVHCQLHGNGCGLSVVEWASDERDEAFIRHQQQSEECAWCQEKIIFIITSFPLMNSGVVFLASLSLLNAPSPAFISQFFSISRLHVLLLLRSLNFSLNSIRLQ